MYVLLLNLFNVGNYEKAGKIFVQKKINFCYILPNVFIVYNLYYTPLFIYSQYFVQMC